MRERFFLTGKTPDAEILDVFPRTLDFLWGKRFRQNRINPYAYPPKDRGFFVEGAGSGRAIDKPLQASGMLRMEFGRGVQGAAPYMEYKKKPSRNGRALILWIVTAVSIPGKERQ